MNPSKVAKHRRKKRLCIQHRQLWYDRAIQKVIDGKAEPEYATKRWKKYKQAKGR